MKKKLKSTDSAQKSRQGDAQDSRLRDGVPYRGSQMMKDLIAALDEIAGCLDGVGARLFDCISVENREKLKITFDEETEMCRDSRMARQLAFQIRSFAKSIV